MSSRIDAYLSSTSRDLVSYRAAARDVLISMNVLPIGMENFSAVGDNPVQLCYDKLQEAELFVGIYAYRYGYVPEGIEYVGANGEKRVTDGRKSITHLEYEWALERNIPLLLFVVQPEQEWPANFVDSDPVPMESFKNEIMQKHVVGFFSSPSDLASKLAAAVHSVLKRSDIATSSAGRNDVDVSGLEALITGAVMRGIELSGAFSKPQELDNEQAGSMRVRPAFSTPPSQNVEFQSDVFVIMPFSDKFFAVYTDAIEPVCDELNLRVKKGNDFFTNEHIMNEIWFALCNCRVVIADCTDRNANVFYELGIAHTLGKAIIPITQNVKDIPFDVSGRRFIEYESGFSGTQKLRTALREILPRVLNRLDEDL